MEKTDIVMVDQGSVRDALERLTPYAVAKFLNVPISVVKHIRDGRDRPYYKVHQDRIKRDDLCTCCKHRKKMPGAKYLCFSCFAHFSGTVGDHECQQKLSAGPCGH